MIEPQELRIGNYTEYNILDSNEDRWVFNEVEVSDLADTSSLRPIPITKDWLERFGFELSGAEYGEDHEIYLYKGFEITKHYAKEEFWMNNSVVLVNRISTIHQLQNLFYALTMQELTIKEK